MKILRCCVLVLASSSVAHAQDRVIGLLTLPEVFGAGPCDRFTPLDVPLYAEAEGKTGVGSIRVATPWTFPADGGCAGLMVHVYANGRSLGDLPAAEYDYEAPAAIVVGQRGRSFNVRIPGGTAWVRASNRDEFRSLQQLLQDGLAYVTDAASGELLAVPGDAGNALPPRVRPGRSVRVVGFRQVKDVLWVDIELMSGSPCQAAGDPTVVARGWLPAHATSGEPTIWFHSRGC